MLTSGTGLQVYAGLLGQGIVVTLELGVLAILFGTLLGAALGMLRVSSWTWLHRPIDSLRSGGALDSGAGIPVRGLLRPAHCPWSWLAVTARQRGSGNVTPQRGVHVPDRPWRARSCAAWTVGGGARAVAELPRRHAQGHSAASDCASFCRPSHCSAWAPSRTRPSPR